MSFSSSYCVRISLSNGTTTAKWRSKGLRSASNTLEDEDRGKWIVWFDSASNTLGCGVGAVLVTPDDQCIPFMARLGFDYTNNMAEYEVCTLGIQAAIDFKVKLLKVYRDSALVIHQLRGEWKTKDHKLIPYQAYIWKLIEYFDDISFHHIPKEEN